MKIPPNFKFTICSQKLLHRIRGVFNKLNHTLMFLHGWYELYLPIIIH